jgi:hypothetical protein
MRKTSSRWKTSRSGRKPAQGGWKKVVVTAGRALWKMFLGVLAKVLLDWAKKIIGL